MVNMNFGKHIDLSISIHFHVQATNSSLMDKFYFRIFFSLSLKNGMRRAESAEFEEHDGHKVLVIRGFFRHIDKNVSGNVNAFGRNRLFFVWIFMLMIPFYVQFTEQGENNSLFIRSHGIS